MHHQHHFRALPRSRQRDGHQRPLRDLRVAPFRPDSGAVHVRVVRAGQRSSVQHRGDGGGDEGVRVAGHARESDDCAGGGGGGEFLGEGGCDQ